MLFRIMTMKWKDSTKQRASTLGKCFSCARLKILPLLVICLLRTALGLEENDDFADNIDNEQDIGFYESLKLTEHLANVSHFHETVPTKSKRQVGQTANPGTKSLECKFSAPLEAIQSIFETALNAQAVAPEVTYEVRDGKCFMSGAPSTWSLYCEKRVYTLISRKSSITEIRRGCAFYSSGAKPTGCGNAEPFYMTARSNNQLLFDGQQTECLCDSDNCNASNNLPRNVSLGLVTCSITMTLIATISLF